MKDLLKVVIIAGLLLSTNSCGVMKNKHLEKTKSSERIRNDIAVSNLKIDSTKGQLNISKTSDKKLYSEEISIKQGPPLENIELTANFKVDTSATLSGDTALKLIDVNNGGVSLSIFQNRKTNELMAKVTTPKGSRTTPFREINIKRKYGEQKDSVYSTSFFENHSELKRDSIDKSEIDRDSKKVVDNKQKEVKSDWKVWLLAALVVCCFIALGFRGK